jgi:hypothetical protein
MAILLRSTDFHAWMNSFMEFGERFDSLAGCYLGRTDASREFDPARIYQAFES